MNTDKQVKESMSNELEQKKIIVISDSTYDDQSGVSRNYYDKNEWIKKTIERMAEKGYLLQQRLPKECMIFKLAQDNLISQAEEVRKQTLEEHLDEIDFKGQNSIALVFTSRPDSKTYIVTKTKY